MLDKKFFSKKDNPARNLLDRLAQVSVAWREDVGEDDPLYQRIAAVVHDVIDNFEEDVSVFDRAVEQLDQYIAEEQKKAEDHAQTAAEVLYKREVAEFAQIMAREEIVKRASKVPPEIQQFLLKYSARRSRQYLRKRRRSQRSLEKQFAGGGRAGLEHRTQAPFGGPSATRAHAAATVAPTGSGDACQIRLRRGNQGILGQAGGVPHRRAEGPAEPGKACRKGRRAVPEPETVPASEVLAAQERDLAAADASAEKIIPAAPPAPATASDEGVVETLAWTLPTKDLTAEDEHDKTAKGLKKGCWVEFALDDGTSLRSKLTWISPMKGVMLFADRDGSNAVKISPRASPSASATAPPACSGTPRWSNARSPT